MPPIVAPWLHRLLLAALLCSLLPFTAHADEEEDFPARLRACAACHGERGRSAEEAYYPSIAGKPAGYLYAQLRNFREGRRQHAVMAAMLAYLSDDYLREIAASSAAQSPAHLAGRGVPATARLQRGRELVEHGDAAIGVPACSACHAASLKGVTPAVPGLLGLRSDYLSAQIGAWKSGVRRSAAPDCMAQIARALSVADIDAVTAWIVSQPQAGDARPEPALPARPPLDCGVLP